ncbi:MAG: M20/M25/M40 family metallo-hydrolase, partial [Bacteroidota bacterium]
VQLKGTLRTLNEEWRFKAHGLIEQLTKGLVESMGGTVETNIMVGYPYLQNDTELTIRNKAFAEEYLGKENVVDLSVRMTAEDFAYYTHEVPGCFYRLGTQSPDGSNAAPVHNSHFDIDEKALETGVGLMAWMALKN